jgi:hypothetical protein
MQFCCKTFSMCRVRARFASRLVVLSEKSCVNAKFLKISPELRREALQSTCDSTAKLTPPSTASTSLLHLLFSSLVSSLDLSLWSFHLCSTPKHEASFARPVHVPGTGNLNDDCATRRFSLSPHSILVRNLHFS